MFVLSDFFCYVYLTIVYFLCLCTFQLFFFLCCCLFECLVVFMYIICFNWPYTLLYYLMALYYYISDTICDPYILCLLPFFYGLISAISFRLPTK